jgi:hypothetical protein
MRRRDTTTYGLPLLGFAARGCTGGTELAMKECSLAMSVADLRRALELSEDGVAVYHP